MAVLADTTGLVLAGGAGRRVGGADKGLLCWEGEPLAAQVVQRLRGEVTTVLISCNRNQAYYATLADRIVADQRPGFAGPLAGIEAAVAVLDSEFLLISPCDAPRLPRDLGARLLAALNKAGADTDISYAHDGERGHYLCAMLRTRILDSLTPELDSGTRAVRDWYRLHKCIAVDFSAQRSCFRNINRMERA
jgi:molybdopterin-guanine dinucleotide biosynthesis protein A